MYKKLLYLISIAFVFTQSATFCQLVEKKAHILSKSVGVNQDSTQLKVKTANKFPNLTAPILVFGMGVMLNSSSLKQTQTDWHQRVVKTYTTNLDDYTSLSTNALALGLGSLGVKPKHSLKDRIKLIAIANSIATAATYGLKFTTGISRPDKSTNDAWPSGHTAIVFTGAQLMHEEYAQNSFLYGIAGYTIAAGTGYMRMVNNRHWLADVVAGAGIGMLSGKLAYVILPKLSKKAESKISITPQYLGNGAGLVIGLEI